MSKTALVTDGFFGMTQTTANTKCWEEVTGGWRKLHNEELHDLPNINAIK
jgi:hypothetical protein